jgi:hypothetical protein
MDLSICEANCSLAYTVHRTLMQTYVQSRVVTSRIYEISHLYRTQFTTVIMSTRQAIPERLSALPVDSQAVTETPGFMSVPH